MSRRERSKRAASNVAKAGGGQKAAATPVGVNVSAGALAGYWLLLAAVAGVLYLPITHHPFINYDDGNYISANPDIQGGLSRAAIKWAATTFYAANWHPLTWLAHILDFQMYGMDAGGHHVTSLLLHVANVVLLFLVAVLATGAVGRSFLLAALFAVHPLNVESVAWAAELKNVLCTLFFLLAIAAYVWYARRPAVWRYGLVVLGFALGLAAKPMVITLPIVLLLLDFWPLRRLRIGGEVAGGSAAVSLQPSFAQLVMEKIPLLMLSAASAWVTIRAQSAGQATTMIHATLGQRISNALVSYAGYMVKFFVPTGLAAFYPFPPHGIAPWKVVASAVALVSVSAGVLRFGWQRGYLVTGWLWFLGTLVPVIGILQVGAQTRADRYMYIPMMGLLVMIVWGSFEFAEVKRWSVAQRTVPAVLAVGVLFALTARQISYWDSSYDLWTHTIAVTQDNAMAEHNLSSELIRLGKSSEVYPHLLRALELDPDDMASHINLGNIYSAQGKHQEALREFVQVAQKSKDPRLLLPAAVNAGSSYLKLGQLQDAEAAYRVALQLAPNQPNAVAGLQAVGRARAATAASTSK